MSPWIAVACSGFFAILGIAERFYARFIPDVEAQKRHLRKAGFIAWTVLSPSSLIVGFWQIAHTRGPVTPWTVLLAGGQYFSLTLFILNFILILALRALDNFERLLKIVEKHMHVTEGEARILEVLASKADAPEEVLEQIQNMLVRMRNATHGLVK